MSLNQQEKEILKSIVVASENDPLKPEFPADDPKFPATPTYKLEIPGFENIYIKDESFNPTGTHKDRMAREMVVTYRDFLVAKEKWQLDLPLPHMSIISSGSAAIAIQTQFKKYKLPNLKVLVDKNIESEILKSMKELWSIIYSTDLSHKKLNFNEILELTENPDGFDITSSEALDPTTRYYDWLSYEIINFSPDYCFIPFGTWNLFENILNITKKEASTTNHDPRFNGDIEAIRKCNFIWATTNDKNSKAAAKLYSPHLPFVHFNGQWIKIYRQAGFCGYDSDVLILKEKYLDEAIKIAKENNIRFEPSWIAWLALFLEMKNQIDSKKRILIVNTWKTKY